MPTSDEAVARFKAEIEILDRMLNQWTGDRGEAYRATVQRKCLWEAELKRTGRRLGLADNPTESPKAAGRNPGLVDRRAMVDAYISEVFAKTGKRITRTDIWQTANYKSRTEFERWERNDPKRPNKSADENFNRILREKPHLK